VNIPEWDEVLEKDKAGQKLTALERFVYDNEPAGPSEAKFREQLAAVIEEARRATGS
jgi:hypothetical protein